MDITVQELKEKLDKGEKFVLVDVREPHEREEFNVGGDFIPIGKITSSMDHFAGKEDEEIVVYCRSGKTWSRLVGGGPGFSISYSACSRLVHKRTECGEHL